jgi:hypothetical protein
LPDDRLQQIENHLADAAELLAFAAEVDLTQALSEAKANDLVSATDELLRATRAQLKTQMTKAAQESVRRAVADERLVQLEQHYKLLQQEVLELEYHRAALALRLGRSEEVELDPVPYASFARRVGRIVFAACLGGIFAGLAAPLVPLLQDPVISKAFEGLVGGTAGALAAEKEDWTNTARENHSRAQQRIGRDYSGVSD